LHDALPICTFGIRFSNLFAENNHVELNEVAGLPATSGGPFTLFGSIYILGGLCDYTLCENTVKNSKYGFRFYGNNQFPIISQNKIYDHEYGLSIFSNVSLGYHDGSGNQWLGAYSQWAAEKEGPISPTPSSPISVRFWVPESDVYPYLPSLSDISPNPDLEADPSRKWFRFNPTIPTAYCEPEENASNFTPAEIQLALGASDLIGAALWDARRQLLRKLLEHPELAPSGSIMATFLNQFQATSVGGFAQFDVAFKNARKFSESQQAVFNSQLLAVQQAQHQVAALLSNAGFNPLNLGTNANATDQWNTHTTNLAAAHKLLADARNARFEQLVQQLTALETTNNNLSATTEQEIAQKYVNAIRLQLSKGIPMTASQYQQVLGISNLPESEVGLAQLEATILLNPCDKLNLPGEAENREKQRRPESANPINEPEAFAVYPNPSAGQVQVEIKRPTNGLLKVLNAQGQVIAHIPFSEQQQLSVDLSNQKTGLYCLQFYDDHNKLLYTTKVVITR
ncbi:MAG: T9SS type A sorting domain-containing protein, partial [Saprospiraceae bacterium]|nr:T9SS type A sorting domain-containing protein [Saprospiraceae bacterium]